MLLRVVDDGEFKDIRIEEGEMFLLPGSRSEEVAKTALIRDFAKGTLHITQ